MVVTLLVERGAATTIVNNNRHSALSYALIVRDDGHSALSYTLLDNKMDVALYLIEQSLPIFSFNEDQNILLLAAANGRADITTNLLKLNPCIDINTVCPISNKTALMLAAENGHLAVATLLVEQGKADTTIVDDNGHSAVNHAATHHKKDVLLYLLETPRSCCELAENKAILLWAAESGYAPIITAVLNANPYLDINTFCPSHNKTALMLAAENGHLAVVTLLVERKADTTIVSSKGHSALSCAAWHNKLNVLQYLLEKPLPHFWFGEDKEILLWAAASGRADIITNLLKLNPCLDINTFCPSHNKTPLMLAAENGHLAVVTLLVERKADTTIVSSKGHSALSYATWYNHPGVMQYLRERSPPHSLRDQEGVYTSSLNQTNAAGINPAECYQNTILTNDDNVSVNLQSNDPSSTLSMLSTSFAPRDGSYMG